MNILKINTPPIFQFIPRKEFDGLVTIKLISETKGTTQTINCFTDLLPNENYNIQLATFPIGKANETFSFTILNGTEVLCLGKLMIISESEIVQNHSKKTNKYY